MTLRQTLSENTVTLTQFAEAQALIANLQATQARLSIPPNAMSTRLIGIISEMVLECQAYVDMAYVMSELSSDEALDAEVPPEKEFLFAKMESAKALLIQTISKK